MKAPYLEIVRLVEQHPDFLTSDIRHPVLDQIARDFNLSQEEARVLAFLVNWQLSDNLDIDMRVIRSDQDLDMETYGWLLEIVTRLKERGLLNLDASEKQSARNPMYPTLNLDEVVSTRLVLGRDPWADLNPSDVFSVADALDRILEQREEKSISEQKCFQLLRYVVDRIPVDRQFARVFQNLNDVDLALVSYATTQYLKGRDSTYVTSFADDILERVSKKARLLTAVQQQKQECIRRGWIELDEEGVFVRDPMFRLSEKAIEILFLGQHHKLTVYKPKFCRLVNHGDMQSNRLFLPVETARHIQLLDQSLTRRNLSRIRSRLKKQGMPTGIACILHGPPGTGKTASVFQLARQRKMNILHVDFANIRDKFVGESEKRLKTVFDEYRTATKRLGRAPILLFNEADALFGSRIGVSNSVDQMNNAMQNILLEEMERFDGILMATTNLIDNLDPAFDRRFLFKVRFERPDATCRKQIWKSKLPALRPKDAETLSQLDLSGAQIENVARKLTMMEVVHGTEPSLEAIMDLARQETSDTGDRRPGIGFTGK